MSTKSTSDSPIARVLLQGMTQRVGDHAVSADLGFGLPLREACSKEAMAKAQRDFEILAAKLKSHPGDMIKMLECVNAGDAKNGVAALKAIGLTESDLKAAGGGLPWVAIAVGVAILLYATDAW